MAGKAYSTESSKSVIFKKAYVVEAGKTVKLKRAYDVEGGKTAALWSSGSRQLIYIDNTTAKLGYSTSGGATGVSLKGLYAIFAGGTTSNSYYPQAFNTSLTKTQINYAYGAIVDQAGTSVGDYAVFGGGRKYTEDNVVSRDVLAINTALTATYKTRAIDYRYDHAAASVGDYALFVGGTTDYDTEECTNTIASVNSSLTASTLSIDYGPAVCRLSGTNANGYALFAGGIYAGGGSYYSGVSAIDASLTKIPINLSTARCNIAAASVGDYTIFAGGQIKNGYTDVVDVYDKSLTRLIGTPLSRTATNVCGVSTGDLAIFAGGFPQQNGSGKIVEIYDTSLTKTIGPSLSYDDMSSGGATVGDYVLIALNRNVIDLYKLT